MNKLKDFANAIKTWLSPLFAVIGAVFESLQIEWLMKIFYILSIALLTMAIIGKKKKTLITPKAQKTTELALNTEIQAMEMLETIKNYKKAGKFMFKLLKTYKGIILAVLIFIGSIITSLTDAFGALWIVNGIDVIPTIGYAISIAIASLSYGIGSPKLKEAIAQLKDQLNGDITDLTKISDIKYLERQVVVYEKEIDKLNKDYVDVIAEYERCIRLDLIVNDEVDYDYKEYKELLEPKTKALNTYKEKIKILTNKSEEY